MMEDSTAKETSRPVAEKLVGMSERLDELLLELGELQDCMPDADDLANLGKPLKTVTLKPSNKAMEQKISHNVSDWESDAPSMSKKTK